MRFHLQTMTGLVLALCLTWDSFAFGWGATGHRAVGAIAERHLSPKARSSVKALLGTETLARASTWGDEVRSDPAYKHQDPWHFVNLPPGGKYDPATATPAGDILRALSRARAELVDKSVPREKRVVALRLFVHFVGDLHQPFHVGINNDMGGNLCNVHFMGNPTNLHALWDEGLIDQSNLSYTELADFVDASRPISGDAISGDATAFVDWATESAAASEALYPGPADHPYCRKTMDAPVMAVAEQPKLSWEYRYQHWPLLEKRIQLAGRRLAAQLNSIFK